MTVVFPLFHLPLVAMEHVLCMMNPYELINLSMTSAKSKKAVMALSRMKSEFSIVLSFYRQPSISILRRGDPWNFRWVSDESRIGYEEFTQFGYVHHNICKHSKKPIEELMELNDYIKEVLKYPLRCVSFDLCAFPTQIKLIADWLRSQSMIYAEIWNSDREKEIGDDLKYLVNNITVVDRMSLQSSRYKEGFQMEIPTTPHSLRITNASFINFEQLLRLKNRKISLGKPCVSAKELNNFLKSWMDRESHLDLEAFDMNISGPEAMEVIMDLSHEETADENVTETFNKKFYPPEVKNGFDIKRCDGKVATVGYGNSSTGPRFYMLTH
uniref:FBA_2 domain-containing protein n=3 Tax=Caenorhabditis tropicalis TaxID=1561998 RepID=A0A1I7TUN0_9PELO